VASLLFQTTPADAPAYLVSLSAIVVTMVLAMLVPARRAAGVDPVIVLRE
jgi:ABC-type antimicrobial peptide transport system permease subunit